MNNVSSSSRISGQFPTSGLFGGETGSFEIEVNLVRSTRLEPIKLHLTQFRIIITSGDDVIDSIDQSESRNKSDQSEWFQLIQLFQNLKSNILLYSIIAIEVIIGKPEVENVNRMFSVSKKMKMVKAKVHLFTKLTKIQIKCLNIRQASRYIGSHYSHDMSHIITSSLCIMSHNL